MKFTFFALLVVLSTSGSVFATSCQDIPLVKRSGNYVKEISLGIKEYHTALKVGDQLVTIMSPISEYTRELTNLTAKVAKITLIDSVKIRNGRELVYGVKFVFPYNPEVARDFNNGTNSFYAICRDYTNK